MERKLLLTFKRRCQADNMCDSLSEFRINFSLDPELAFYSACFLHLFYFRKYFRKQVVSVLHALRGRDCQTQITRC